jgi:putative salt-induced outer membrane protein
MSLPILTLLRRNGIAFASVLSIGGPAAQAQTELDDQWRGSVSVGGAVASGNTSSQALTVSADAVKANPKDKISLNGLANYGANKTAGVRTTTANRVSLGGRYDYNLTDVVFAFGGADAETNKAGGLSSRYALNGGAGYKLIRSASTTFDVFAGLGYAHIEFTDNTSAGGVELLLGEESTHKLSASTSAKQRFVFRPGRGDLGNLATFDASLSTAVTGAWSLNTGLVVRYASKAAPGLKSTDTLLTVGFGYKY